MLPHGITPMGIIHTCPGRCLVDVPRTEHDPRNDHSLGDWLERGGRGGRKLAREAEGRHHIDLSHSDWSKTSGSGDGDL
jgi:hypothetical protein